MIGRLKRWGAYWRFRVSIAFEKQISRMRWCGAWKKRRGLLSNRCVEALGPVS